MITRARISRATSADLDALVPLFDGYRQFYGRPSDPGLARTFLDERLARDESVVFLATIDDSPAGMAQLFPCFSSVLARRIFILNDLFVAPEHRRYGVGRALLDQSVQFGREEGAGRLMLRTARTNLIAQAAYEAGGWTQDDAFLTYNFDLTD